MVHLFGAAADMPAVAKLTAPRGIPIIEDACQAIGTRVGDQLAGAIGLCGAFSTFPSKNLGGPGDGGFLTTNDAAFATRCKQLRNHGQSDTYKHDRVGGNFRLDELQCAVLRVKLPHLDGWNAKRRTDAERYRGLLVEKGLSDRVQLPEDQPGHTYHQCVTHLQGVDRDGVRKKLTDAGIGCAVYYPIPLHEQPCFVSLSYKRAARTNLALPIFPELTEAEAVEVFDALAAAER